MSKKIEKHYIEFVEELLYHYKNIEIYIQSLEEMLNDLNKGIFIQGINYDNVKVSPTYKIQNSIMDNAVDIAEAKREIEIKIYTEKRLKRLLDSALNNLPVYLRQIIEFRYIEKMDWQEIEDRGCFSRRVAIDKRDSAIESIAISLFGIKISGNIPLIDMLEA